MTYGKLITHYTVTGYSFTQLSMSYIDQTLVLANSAVSATIS